MFGWYKRVKLTFVPVFGGMEDALPVVSARPGAGSDVKKEINKNGPEYNFSGSCPVIDTGPCNRVHKQLFNR